PCTDTFGNLFNRAVNPDDVSVNGTVMEVRVPDDAITGGIRVIGAGGTIPLQVVPTLKLAERFGGSSVGLLGSGFTENTGLAVTFGGTTVADTGGNIDVYDSNTFTANDTLFTNQPAGSGDAVTVTTAGGTSAALSLATDDPASIGGLNDLAI